VRADEGRAERTRSRRFHQKRDPLASLEALTITNDREWLDAFRIFEFKIRASSPRPVLQSRRAEGRRQRSPICQFC
jgi:hypothetical protein